MNWFVFSIFAAGVLFVIGAVEAAAQPNVIIVMTDDQGYGELSCHGNPVLQTPNLDRLHDESIRLTDYHAAPMCTPTRGQLMSGLDALRNGAMNVSSGRTLLRADLPTMANVFAASGYATGIFGKWHLGDNFPYRPQDRGFQETLWFPSSHISSTPDVWNNDYFDDTYSHNGKREAFEGYTTDVFFREAMTWMKGRKEAGQPFFCYLPTAAPHGPHFVPDHYREPVRRALEAARDRLPKIPPKQEEPLVSYLAMIANIDENMGRLEAFLSHSGLREDTLLVFMSDNGSTMGPIYYNAGMKGKKVTLWEGGHRVPCFVRWPGGSLQPPRDLGGLAEAQDWLPTLIDLCGLKAPDEARFDGVSLAEALRGSEPVPEERMLVINYSRMPIGVNEPSPNPPSLPRREGAAVLWKRWRLLEDKELYDLDNDPLQERNMIEQYPEVAAKMREHLDAWWKGVEADANTIHRVTIGDDRENPALLSACEWLDVFIDQQAQIRRGERKNGVWHLHVAQPGRYTFRLRRYPAESGLKLTDAAEETRVTDGTYVAGPAFPIASAVLRIGDREESVAVKPDDTSVDFTLQLESGSTEMQTWFLDAEGGPIAGAYFVEVERG